MDVALPILAGLTGVIIGAYLARRNERRAHADRLLAEALNDLVAAIADVAAGDQSAQRRYASATSRVALHGSAELVDALRGFQVDATTGTDDGRQRFLAAVQAARQTLGRPAVDDAAARILLFGPERPQQR